MIDLTQHPISEGAQVNDGESHGGFLKGLGGLSSYGMKREEIKQVRLLNIFLRLDL
jgi:hypothetical protein